MDERTERGRGFGRFSSRQLTTLLCVLIASLVLVPTVAFAASGAFTSTTVDPAVSGINSSPAANAIGVRGQATAAGSIVHIGVAGYAQGPLAIGVKGTGVSYGVYSNGPLGVAPGSSLSCTGCVTTADLAAAAQQVHPLATGESESGAFGAADSYPAAQKDVLVTPINLARPVSGTITLENAPAPTAHCPGAGTAAAGFLCLYPTSTADAAFQTSHPVGTPMVGTVLIWTEGGGGVAYVYGSYTVTAP